MIHQNKPTSRNTAATRSKTLSGFGRFLGLGLAVTLGLSQTAMPSWAAAAERKTESGPLNVEPGSHNGKDGYWVRWAEYTYERVALFEQIREIYVKVFGGVWPEEQLLGAEKWVLAHNSDLAALEARLWDAKKLTDHNTDWAKEWHARSWDIGLLKSKFGNSGGWIDGISTNNAAAWYNSIAASGIDARFVEGAGGDGASIAGQATRLLQLAGLIQEGLLPEGRFEVVGVFTHYWRSYNNIGTSAYFAPLTTNYGGESGGSWGDITSLVAGGANADQAQRAIYKWYSERWGTGYKIDITPSKFTAADLIEAARQIYRSAASTGSPIVLDRSGNGRIDVTGRSTAEHRNAANAFVPEHSVLFDLFGTGKPIRIEWTQDTGDAFLVDDRKGVVTMASKGDGRISGLQLFGSAGGFDNGYIKLALILLEQNRFAMGQDPAGYKVQTALRGPGLAGLKAWADLNHDARVQPGELKTLAELGISELEVFPRRVTNDSGETLIQSDYVEGDGRKLAEDVWFAIHPADAPKDVKLLPKGASQFPKGAKQLPRDAKPLPKAPAKSPKQTQ